MQDICKPDAIRLRRNLSAVINFGKFREEKFAQYAEMHEQTLELLEETQALEDTNKELVRAAHVWRNTARRSNRETLCARLHVSK